ncbi:hypothetical protein Syun_005266 [Stephania yunnanensis]|uniref:Dof zinc finger protein n=1 Tax=Stephania yunnanensis TaxID=152371 RepID=A0AAP0Q3A6_9MAGN
MIHELFGDVGERKISFNGGSVLFESSPSLSPSPISSSSAAATTSTVTTNPPTSSAPENLRCPRCDSSNTKFCYYNNYNLTQPRHFCKTCRRYWTKGGALRNIPIGGGCRKNKTSISAASSSTASKSSTAGKAKPNYVCSSSSEIIKNLGSGFSSTHHLLGSSNNSGTVLWGSPQSSQMLAFLKATQNPNPNIPLSNSMITSIKDDQGPIIGSSPNVNNVGSSSSLVGARALSLESTDLGHQVPSTNGLFGSLSRNNHIQNHQSQLLQLQHTLPQQSGGVLLGEIQNMGNVHQELFQRVRSLSNQYSTADCSTQGLALSMLNNNSSSISEPAGIGSGGEFGHWNNQQPFSWFDLHASSNPSFP